MSLFVKQLHYLFSVPRAHNLFPFFSVALHLLRCCFQSNCNWMFHHRSRRVWTLKKLVGAAKLQKSAVATVMLHEQRCSSDALGVGHGYKGRDFCHTFCIVCGILEASAEYVLLFPRDLACTFFFYCIVNADGPNLGWHVVRYIVKAVVRGSVVMNVECSLACASFRSALSRTGSERLSWKLSWMPLRGYASSLLQPCLSLMVLTYQQWECLFQFMQYCLHLSSGAHWPLTYCWHFN